MEQRMRGREHGVHAVESPLTPLFMKRNPIALRKGVRKALLKEGASDAIPVLPFSRVRLQYTVHLVKEGPPESSPTSSEGEVSSEDSLLDSPSMSLAFERIDNKENNNGVVEVMLGRNALVPGLESALLTMRKGEHARVSFPTTASELVHLRIPRLSFLEYDVTVLDVAHEVDLSPCKDRSLLKHIILPATNGAAPHPEFESFVQFDLMTISDLTGKPVGQQTIQFEVGGVDYDERYDRVASSMREGEFAQVSLCEQIYCLRLKAVARSGPLSKLARNKQEAWGNAESRKKEADKLTMANWYPKARQKYLRSLEILLAAYGGDNEKVVSSLDAKASAHCRTCAVAACLSSTRWSDWALAEQDATLALKFARENSSFHEIHILRARARRYRKEILLAKQDLDVVLRLLPPGAPVPVDVSSEVEELRQLQLQVEQSAVAAAEV